MGLFLPALLVFAAFQLPVIAGWIQAADIQLPQLFRRIDVDQNKGLCAMSKTEFEPDIIAQTDNFGVWQSDDEDEGLLFHLELGGVTLHLNSEEWDELVLLIKAADQ